MSHELDTAVAQAIAREDATLPVSKGGPPRGGMLDAPPEPWELVQGSAADRIQKQGRTVLDYAKKMEDLGQ